MLIMIHNNIFKVIHTNGSCRQKEMKRGRRSNFMSQFSSNNLRMYYMLFMMIDTQWKIDSIKLFLVLFMMYLDSMNNVYYDDQIILTFLSF
jgi:hypothetical protein